MGEKMSEVKKCPSVVEKWRKEESEGTAIIDARFDTSESFWFAKGVKIRAFSCLNCGFIELYREKKDSTK
jgi:hypothetical protein